MVPLISAKRLNILLFIRDRTESEVLQEEFAADGYVVQWQPDFQAASDEIRRLTVDYLIADETVDRPDGQEGVRLAEICRDLNQTMPGNHITRAILLVPIYERFREWKSTCAHIISKEMGLQPLLGYIRGLLSPIFSDLTTGPFLYGFHLYSGGPVDPECRYCEWLGSSLSFGANWYDLDLRPREAQTLNILFARKRGLSRREVEELARVNPFLRSLGGNRVLVEAAVRMSISRLRETISKGLREIAAPYLGSHFLPYVAHGFGRYKLAGNWDLVHVTKKAALERSAA